ncbi:MAG: ATPase, T2SS/T4P/T4SS family, partial [Candidatus Aureabacteria bacterium]|nr:ATPase, T2SS/T4P/T4SS family [Candidatus Auribacterota bacterium]
MARSLTERLPEILVQSGCVAPDVMEKARGEQREKGGSIVHILVEKGYVPEKALMTAIAEEMSVPPIDLTKFKPAAEVLELISRQIAGAYQVVPLGRLGRALSVAMVDPFDVVAIDNLRLITGFEIQPAVCSAKEFREALENYYSPKANMEHLLRDAEMPRVELTRRESDQEINLDELLERTGEVSIIKIVNLILVQAIKDRASDVHIEPFEKELRLRYRVDGILYDSASPPKHMQAAIVSRIKIMSNLDIAERRLPQDGRFRVKVHGREIDLRISIIPFMHGEGVVMRILDKQAILLSMEELGFDLDMLKIFEKV